MVFDAVNKYEHIPRKNNQREPDSLRTFLRIFSKYETRLQSGRKLDKRKTCQKGDMAVRSI